MANEEINDQTAVTSATRSDEYLLQKTVGGVNRKITHANMMSNIKMLNIGAGVVYTIVSGVIAVTGSHILVDAEGTSADDLDTINGTSEGDILVIRLSGANAVTLKDGTGNMNLAGDFVLDSIADVIVLFERGATLLEVCRSNNA